MSLHETQKPKKELALEEVRGLRARREEIATCSDLLKVGWGRCSRFFLLNEGHHSHLSEVSMMKIFWILQELHT